MPDQFGLSPAFQVRGSASVDGVSATIDIRAGDMIILGISLCLFASLPLCRGLRLFQ
jgi:hypothetical protein